MADTLSPRAWSRTARARVASHNPVRPVRSNRWSALRSLRVSRSGRARRPPFFMRRRVSHGRATLGSNFRDTALAVAARRNVRVGDGPLVVDRPVDHARIGTLPLAVEDSQDPRHVVARLWVGWDPAVRRDGPLAGVVRGERQRQVVPEPVDEAAQVPDTPVDVLVRVERVPHPEDGRGLRHELHQAAGALRRDGSRIERGLDADDRRHETSRHPVTIGGAPDLRGVPARVTARQSEPPRFGARREARDALVARVGRGVGEVDGAVLHTQPVRLSEAGWLRLPGGDPSWYTTEI